MGAPPAKSESKTGPAINAGPVLSALSGVYLRPRLGAENGRAPAVYRRGRFCRKAAALPPPVRGPSAGMALSVKQRRGKVTVAGIGQQRNYHLAIVFLTLCNLSRRIKRRSR